MVEAKTPIIDYVQKHFYEEYLEGLKEFVRIPSLSPIFDEDWQTNQALFKQMDHLMNYAKAQNIAGMKLIPLKDEGRSPFLIVDVDASAGTEEGKTAPDYTVLLYGHMDKQPFGEGWETDPCDPVIKEDGKMYGRGSSDDGYSFFTSMLAIKACQDLGKSHPRCIITIEGSEEGEIDDLIHYIKNYKDQMGNPDLVICLDSLAYTDKTITITSSLRGCLNFDLKCTVGSQNCHSGMAGGIIPNCYQILTQVLGRVQNFKTQDMTEEFQVEIPSYRIEETRQLAKDYPLLTDALPILETTSCVSGDAKAFENKEEQNLAMHLANWWKPSLSVIGVAGMPNNLAQAGNVIYKDMTLRCSMRLAPTSNGQQINKLLEEKLTEETMDSFQSKLEYTLLDAGDGFSAPDLPADVKSKLNAATAQVFGEGIEPTYVGVGGSIPFMEIFMKEFPKANFMLTGCAFADSNIHAPNENIDLKFCANLTSVIALVLSTL